MADQNNFQRTAPVQYSAQPPVQRIVQPDLRAAQPTAQPPAQPAQYTTQYTAQPTAQPGQYTAQVVIPVIPVQPVKPVQLDETVKSIYLNITNIIKWLTPLLIILVILSITNSILAIQYYYSIEDINIKNNTKNLLITAIINIFFTIACFIAFIINFYFIKTKIMGFITYIIGFLTIIISIIVNTDLYNNIIKYNKDYMFIFAIVNNTLYLPAWIVMMYSFLLIWPEK
jgi:hypothetical protein